MNIRKLLGLKPNDWERVDEITSEYETYRVYNGRKILGSEKTRKAIFVVYYSKSRNKYKIINEGYEPTHIDEDDGYRALKLKYKL